MRTGLFVALALMTEIASADSTRTITVAQSGKADVVGSDSIALQKAADLLKPGDTLVVGAGTYAMENSLFIPSDVTVRGEPGKTAKRFCAKARESPARSRRTATMAKPCL
jgi:hypothetical protein